MSTHSEMHAHHSDLVSQAKTSKKKKNVSPFLQSPGSSGYVQEFYNFSAAVGLDSLQGYFKNPLDTNLKIKLKDLGNGVAFCFVSFWPFLSFIFILQSLELIHSPIHELILALSMSL